MTVLYRVTHHVDPNLPGPGHSMECETFFSMEGKAAIPWSCYAINSMEFHGITGLTVSKCMAVDIMERFHTIAGLTLCM